MGELEGNQAGFQTCLAGSENPTWFLSILQKISYSPSIQAEISRKCFSFPVNIFEISKTFPGAYLEKNLMIFTN